MADRRSTPRASVHLQGDTVFVEGALDFDTVSDLDDQLNSWFAGGGDTLHVDLSGVQFCNSAGISLMLEWMRAARRQGRQLRLQHLPADMLAMAELIGLSSVFVEQPD